LINHLNLIEGGDEMTLAIFKQVAFETLFAVGLVVVSSYILWVSLKTGLVFGRWPGQVCNKNENPIVYWFGVSVYAFFLACSIYILVMVIKGDIIAFNWPTLPN
jgi:hypothetical protein